MRERGDHGAGEAVEVQPAQVEHAVFTVTAEGARLWFDPNEVGPYSEGTVDVSIPWEALAPWLSAGANKD